MFTGLVEEVGVVRRVERRPQGARLVIAARKTVSGTKVGESIAVSGACLTVTDVGAESFEAECMPETLVRTTLGTVTRGTEVNLERALALGDRLGGHLVLGHVDAVVTVSELKRRGDALEVSLELPLQLRGLIAEKGSVALDGVSLTVMSVGAQQFTVGLIPHTLGETTLRALEKGKCLNLEVDVLARYVSSYLMSGGTETDGQVAATEGLTMGLLIEKGFA